MAESKKRSEWGRLAFAFEPIDFEALAAAARQRRRPSRESIRKMLEARARNKKRRQRAATERRKPTPGPCKVKNRYAVLGAMAPGRWYAMRDIQVAAGIEKCRLTATLSRMREAGFLERAKNPDFVAIVSGRGGRGGDGPRYLWKLTSEGEAERGAWLAAGAPAETVLPAAWRGGGVRFARGDGVGVETTRNAGGDGAGV